MLWVYPYLTQLCFIKGFNKIEKIWFLNLFKWYKNVILFLCSCAAQTVFITSYPNYYKNEEVSVCLNLCLSVIQSRRNYYNEFNQILKNSTVTRSKIGYIRFDIFSI